MNKRYWIAVSLASMGIVGCMLIPKTPPSQTTPQAIAELAMPDLDQDGQADRLRVMPTEAEGVVRIRLDGTNGAPPHDMFTVKAHSPLRFEQQDNQWLLLGEGAAPLARVKLFQNPNAKVPDLIVIGQEEARRYVFIDRGFLKLDARELIAGFSIGLVMVGDPVEALETIGGPVAEDGTWHMPLGQPIPLKVQLNPERRVDRVTFESSLLHSRQGFSVGVPAATLESLLPGHRQSNFWYSPRYGVIGHIGDDQKIEALSITMPWKEEPAKQP